ncbi:MAG: efflux RND transporter periplasmic adaptor subunit [Myxococcota bacterium]
MSEYDETRESGENPAAEEPAAPATESAEARPSRGRQVLTYAAIAVTVVLVLGGIVGAKADQIGAMIEDGDNFQLPPVAITDAEAVRVTWSATSEAVGSIVARRTVPLAAEVGGKVTRVGFESGDDVRRGQLLLSLDAALPRAELAQADARLRLAWLELARVETLRARGARTDADFERAEADRDLAKAARDAAAASVRMRSVKAPFAGRIGIRDVEPGQIVQAGTVVASLQAAEAPEVQFFVGEDEVPGLAPGLQVEVRASGHEAPLRGTVRALDNAVREGSRSLRVRAALEIPDGAAAPVPGTYATVVLSRAQERQVLAIPETAVSYAAYGTSVFVLEERDGALVARQAFVRLGERRSNVVEVREGLEPGARIAASGVFKLQDGFRVVIDAEADGGSAGGGGADGSEG